MVLVFTIILLIEYHNFKKSLVRFIPNKFLEIGLRTIYNIEQQTSKYLRGQILAASSVAILSIIGLIILSAFFSGLIACKLMLKLVEKSSLYYFSFYCFVVGLLSIVYALK